jgi:hypothetical protein
MSLDALAALSLSSSIEHVTAVPAAPDGGQDVALLRQCVTELTTVNESQPAYPILPCVQASPLHLVLSVVAISIFQYWRRPRARTLTAPGKRGPARCRTRSHAASASG